MCLRPHASDGGQTGKQTHDRVPACGQVRKVLPLQEFHAGRGEKDLSRKRTPILTSIPGAVNFNVSIKIDIKELAGWQPDQIKAFFNGIALVLRAKDEAEGEKKS